MMQILVTMCLIEAPATCEERTLTFQPPIPVACIFAAGPELAGTVPEGWEIRAWSCLPPVDAPAR